MRRLGRAWNRTTRIMGWASAVIIASMMALVVVDVVGRKFFTFAIMGTVELVSALLVVCAFLAWSFTESENRHVKVEFVLERLPSTMRLVLEAIAQLMVLAFMPVLIWQTTGYALEAVHPLKLYDSARIAVFPFRLIVPVGCLLFTLQLLVNLVSLVTKLVTRARR